MEQIESLERAQIDWKFDKVSTEKGENLPIYKATNNSTKQKGDEDNTTMRSMPPESSAKCNKTRERFFRDIYKSLCSKFSLTSPQHVFVTLQPSHMIGQNQNSLTASKNNIWKHFYRLTLLLSRFVYSKLCWLRRIKSSTKRQQRKVKHKRKAKASHASALRL